VRLADLNRILCVEDEPDIQAVARLALELVGGFTVQVCGTGEEALTVVPRFKPDLILLDVMMPGMDGPAFLAHLRQQPEMDTIPVIFMTARVQPAEIARFTNLGALDVIAKPFDPLALAGQVRSIWERHV
jgi:CheY-like chemotaxis protein